ncbi:MAG: WG repeat-containing protein [Bifidobacteriaceae bacterium]|jgi:hypothetical protein|nr:WG repeat-containing protein [Bifidobacteriaceae bacterium]
MGKVLIWLTTVVLVAASWFMALTRQPENHDEELAALRAQIDSALELDLIKRTIPLYGEAIKLAPDDPQWHYGLADALEALDEKRAYQTALAQASAQFPDDVTLGVRLLQAYKDDGACQKLVKTYKAASDAVRGHKGAVALYNGCAWRTFPRSDAQYERIYPESGGYFKVELLNKYGYLNSGGRLTITIQFDQARSFLDGWAAVRTDGEWYFIDDEGDRIQAFEGAVAQDLYSFSEGYAVAKIDGKYGYVDKDLKRFAFGYDDARPFTGGVAPVKKNGKWGLIDSEFNMVVEPSYDDVACAESGVCTDHGRVAFEKSGQWRLYDLTGQRLGEGSWESVTAFGVATVVAQRGEGWEVVDETGKVVAKSTADEVRALSGGAMPVRDGEQWTYVDKDGHLLGDDTYTDAYPLTDEGEAVIGLADGYKIVRFMGFME